jgi:phenylpropionate dioxygenase-like ring-hydroxylating dioxygenase large terminal subunit
MSSTATTPRRGQPAPREIVDRLLQHLREGTTDLCPDTMQLEASIFSDPEVARQELDNVFGRVPMIAAHGSELSKPNDFVAKRLARNDVVMVRQDDGSVRTFVNMCRHRGARLVDEADGHCRRFSCPYHGWSYGTDGGLRSITYPESFGEVDRSQLGLIELPTEERHGFVWVVDNPSASIDMASWLGTEMDDLLTSYDLSAFESYQPRSYDQPVNWKVMHDAFLDGYHIKFAHPNSAGKQVHTNIYFTEQRGRHWRFASPRKNIEPWIAGDFDEPPDLSNIIVTHFVSPNTTLLQLDDNFQVLTFYPTSEDPFSARMEMRVLVPSVGSADMDEDAWVAKWNKNWHILEIVLAGEDFPILRDIQHGYANASPSSAILGRNEVLNQAFHRDIDHLRAGGDI